MWIRTECGIIAKLEVIRVGITHYSNGIYHKGKWFRDENDKKLKIKSKGDNLIDVLEVGDMVFSNEYNESGIITRKDKFTVCTRNTNWEIRFIDKVITHEKYMPLAQDVK